MTVTVVRPSMKISRTVSGIPQALSIYFNQIVYDLKRRGEDITTLSLGEAFFDLPLLDFKTLDLSKAFHYSDSQGLPEMRQAIAGYYGRLYGAKVDHKEEVLISVGSKAIIFLAMMTALDPGDEVVIHEPAWLSYPEQAKLVGAVPRFIPYDVAVADFPRHFTQATRMMIICNPNNPAGRVYSEGELGRLYAACRARGIYLLVDEAYSDFVLDDSFVSMARIAPSKDGVIVVNSISKNMGISGWRIGYAISHPQFIRNLLKVNQHTVTCAPTILLQYCAQYFDQLLEITLPQVREVVTKRKRVAAMMDELGIPRLPGSSTFYLFGHIGNFPASSMEFCLSLLINSQIAVVPGSAYGPSTERFVRISIGTESEERIWNALLLIRDLSRRNSFDTGALYRRMAEMRIALPSGELPTVG
jgi:aspartate aminotransferase/aminotransferase